MIIGLENEHACNIATGAETARVLAALDHPNLQVVWDPANAVVSGEKSDTISVYSIDQASGALALLKKYPAGKGANWVEIVSFD